MGEPGRMNGNLGAYGGRGECLVPGTKYRANVTAITAPWNHKCDPGECAPGRPRHTIERAALCGEPSSPAIEKAGRSA